MDIALPFQPRTQEAILLDDLLSQMGARSVKVLGSGGSPARVLHIVTGESTDIVLKYLFANDGLVDGHDLDTFRLKLAQIQRIHTDLPSLRPFYSEVLKQYEGANWLAYCMPFYAGETITKPLREKIVDFSQFACNLQYVIQTLIEHGYKTRSKAAPDHYVEQVHIDRVKRRQWLLHRHLPPEVLSGNYLLINNQVCIPGLKLIENLSQIVAFLKILQPLELHYPIHGDANLGNFILQNFPADGRLKGHMMFKILDPRGTLNYMDASYDFAKMLFSLSLFELAMEYGFDIRKKAERAYELKLRGRHHKGYLDAAVNFLDILENVESYRNLTRDFTIEWRWRILFAHAIHSIAEAANRLSDRKERIQGDKQGFEVCQELALGLYLAGTLLLNDLLSVKIPYRHIDCSKNMEILRTIYM